MGELKETRQKGSGFRTGMTPEGEEGRHNQGAEFGARAPATAGTDRDLDRTERASNQGHGHPREKRGAHHD